MKGKYDMKFASIVAGVTGIILILIYISCATTIANLTQIRSPKVFSIKTPAAGNYPQGLYKYPYKEGSLEEEPFTQTLEWSPAISKTFAINTAYTATLTLDPVNKRYTFEGISRSGIIGLPELNVENISVETKGRSLVIKIDFKPTAGINTASQIIFSDDFNGTALDKTKWELCPEQERQGRSSWKDNMVSVGNGYLRLKFMRDQTLGRSKTTNKVLADNWIRAGGIRTMKKDYSPLFENSYGYYEARIKFPVVCGTWGAFWLMSRTQWITSDEGIDGTEIDIVETIHNNEGKYNAALNWNGYGNLHKATGSDGGAFSESAASPVNIYDGDFHIFALDWSPSEYVVYTDGIEFWRSDGSAKFNNSGINQNPNFIKLTVEGAEWAGLLPEDFTEGEMLVDYVRVYNQPRN
jgi:beta-glucanase (GH16 family)